MLPSSITPNTCATLYCRVPIVVDNLPFSVLARLSIPPLNLDCINELSAVISLLTSFKLPLESNISLTPIFSPSFIIISLVIPNSFNLSSSPLLASKKASVACSNGLPIAPAISPMLPNTFLGSAPCIFNLTVEAITSSLLNGVALANLLAQAKYSAAAFLFPANAVVI